VLVERVEVERGGNITITSMITTTLMEEGKMAVGEAMVADTARGRIKRGGKRVQMHMKRCRSTRQRGRSRAGSGSTFDEVTRLRIRDYKIEGGCLLR
jgi:hypothetical protein